MAPIDEARQKLLRIRERVKALGRLDLEPRESMKATLRQELESLIAEATLLTTTGLAEDQALARVILQDASALLERL